MSAFKDFFTKGTLFGLEPEIMAKDIPPATNIGGVRDQFLRNKAKRKKKNVTTAAKTTPAGVDTSKSSYGAAGKGGKPAKLGEVYAPTFDAAFKIARKQLGAGKTFTYTGPGPRKGKKFTTDLAKSKKTTTVAGPVQGPPNRPTTKSKKLSAVERRRQARKNRNKGTGRTDRGASVRRRTRGRNVNDFKTITSKQSGIPDTQPFSEGGFASMDDYMKDLL